jgi:radical SAM protein with 4Fe4S-binding SPASM domain
MPDLEGLAELLVTLGVRAWQVQLTVAMGRAADRVTELVLQPFELLELFPRLAAIQRSILVPAAVQLAPANNIGYFGPYESTLRLGGEDGVHWEGCPAGQWALGIEADGSLKGCPSLPSASYIGGNLRETPLAALLSSEPLRRLADRDADALWGFCRGCYYADVCKGGCSWTAHSTLGRPGNNPFCHHRALELKARGLRERLVPAVRAPGLPFDHGRLDLVEEPWPPPPS